MDEEHRERLLESVFTAAPRADKDTAAGPFDPAVLADIIIGLVFAQRPIQTAGKEATQRYDLGPRGTFIMSLISRGVRYPKDLAIILKVGRSLITAELARLGEAGLISTSAGHDRRRIELNLTALGETVHASVRGRLVSHLQNSLSGYTAGEIASFATMLRKIGAASD